MNSDKDFNIEKPQIYNDKWLIFSNSILEQLDTVDCNDTIDGKCDRDKTFNECVKLCNDNSNCFYGYYISNDDENICVALRDLKEKIDVNPVYKLRHKDIYPELKDYNVKTFIDKSKYDFPPLLANTIFLLDNFIIQNVETSNILENTNSTKINFGKDKNLIIQITPAEFTSVHFSSEKYIVLKYGEKFNFNIPSTRLNIQKNNNIFEWSNNTNTSFYLYPTMKGKKIGDNVHWSDTFIIKYENDKFSLAETKPALLSAARCWRAIAKVK